MHMSFIVEGCRSFWKEPPFAPNVDAKYHAPLSRYGMLYRVSALAFLAMELTGFVLLGFAFKTPPPFHMMTGVYVLIGGLAAFPIALCAITSKRDAYCKANSINPTKIHMSSPRPKNDD